jgi:hypothetical protein
MAAGLCGCANQNYRAQSGAGLAGQDPFAAPTDLAPDSANVAVPRMLVWEADLTVEVRGLSNAVTRAMQIATQAGGYVESQSVHEESASLKLRLPTAAFHASIGTLESLGSVVSRRVQAEDVTAQYVDIEARMKAKTQLRDRLQQLLARATDVKDVLAIETELNRVQADLDSMTARLNVLRGQVDFATVDLTFRRQRILGPLGYLFKGLWWGVEKLFVIRR